MKLEKVTLKEATAARIRLLTASSIVSGLGIILGDTTPVVLWPDIMTASGVHELHKNFGVAMMSLPEQHPVPVIAVTKAMADAILDYDDMYIPALYFGLAMIELGYAEKTTKLGYQVLKNLKYRMFMTDRIDRECDELACEYVDPEKYWAAMRRTYEGQKMNMRSINLRYRAWYGKAHRAGRV